MGRIIGPVHTCSTPQGVDVPLYVLKFDDRGACTTPRSRDHLLEHLGRAQVSDVVIASHGWNTTPKGAIELYERWMARFAETTAAHPPKPDFRPVVVGIVWPSTWLVPPWERGPRIAAGEGASTQERDDFAADLREAVAGDLGPLIDDAQLQRFHELIDADHLTDDEARELVEIVSPHLGVDDDDEAPLDQAAIDDLMAAWTGEGPGEFVPEDPDALPRLPGDDAPTAPPGDRDPQIAGAGRLVIDGLRLFSVYRMKDRAATVGARGVAEVVGAAHAAGAAVHGVGHSFGCKVLLSAVGSPLQAPLPADAVASLLLIQPAVNGYAMADAIPELDDKPGGYRHVQDLVAGPIMATFTRHDSALRTWFHKALRRGADLGEPRIAAGDQPPDRFAAMGGYGPRGVASSLTIDTPEVGTDFPAEAAGVQVLALRSHMSIDGHGSHDVPEMHWALRCAIAGIP